MEVTIRNRSAERIQGAWLVVYAQEGVHIRVEGPAVEYLWAYDEEGRVDWARSEATRTGEVVVYHVDTVDVQVGLGDIAPGEVVTVTAWGSLCS